MDRGHRDKPELRIDMRSVRRPVNSSVDISRFLCGNQNSAKQNVSRIEIVCRASREPGKKITSIARCHDAIYMSTETTSPELLVLWTRLGLEILMTEPCMNPTALAGGYP